jgi:hypothetical protein
MHFDLIYIYIFVILFYLSIIVTFLKHKNIDIFFAVLIVIILLLISTIRETGGTDLSVYLNLWRAIKPFSIETLYGDFSYFEVGFRYLLSILKFINSSVYFYKFSISLILFFVLFLSIKNVNGNITIGFFIFYLSFFVSYNLNAIGQGLTMAIFCLVLPVLYKSNRFSYLLTSFSFSFLHKSMILSSIFLPNKSTHLNKTVYFLILFALILLSYSGHIKDLTGTLLHNFFNIDHSIFHNQINFLDIAQRFVLLIFMYYVSNQTSDNNFDKFLFKIYAYSLFLYFIFSAFPITATRIHMFFRIIEVILISRFYSSSVPFNNKLLVMFFIILFYTPGFYVQIAHIDSKLGI